MYTIEELINGAYLNELPYKERVALFVRTKYSIDDELAILRQRDSKPEEFEEYNNYVETIKQEEKMREILIQEEGNK